MKLLCVFNFTKSAKKSQNRTTAFYPYPPHVVSFKAFSTGCRTEMRQKTTLMIASIAKTHFTNLFH